MNQNADKAGSFSTEYGKKLLWTYADLSQATGFSEGVLRIWVHQRRIRPPAILRFGRAVRFDPEKTMARIRQLGAEHVS